MQNNSHSLERVGQLEALRLSLCMIIRNEEVCLEDCLRSVRDAVDEIIIVDTGSTDQSIALAENWGATVYQHPWESDFAMARNQSISYAQGDWILIMDADERLNSLAQDWLIQFKKQAQTPVRYLVQIVNLDESQQAISCYFMQRLFPNFKGLRFVSAIHENIIDDTQQIPCLVLDLPFYEHLGLQDVHQQRQQKLARNLTILLGECRKYPQDPHLLYHLGNAYRNVGLINQAIYSFQSVLQLRLAKTNPDHPMFAQALAELIEAQLFINRPDQAIRVAENESFKIYPPSYWYYLGKAYRQQRKLTQARRCFESALMLDPLRSGQSLPFTHEIAHMRQLPLLQLCYLFQFQSLDPTTSSDLRQQYTQLRMKALLNLIDLFPEGGWPQLHMNLYLQFAEALVVYFLLTPETYTASAFAEQMGTRFHLQPNFQAVDLAWQELNLSPTQWLQPATGLQQISRYWLQGIWFKQAHLHAQIWQDFSTHFTVEILHSMRLISSLLLKQESA